MPSRNPDLDAARGLLTGVAVGMVLWAVVLITLAVIV